MMPVQVVVGLTGIVLASSVALAGDSLNEPLRRDLNERGYPKVLSVEARQEHAGWVTNNSTGRALSAYLGYTHSPRGVEVLDDRVEARLVGDASARLDAFVRGILEGRGGDPSEEGRAFETLLLQILKPAQDDVGAYRTDEGPH